jgi:hypothetical protein
MPKQRETPAGGPGLGDDCSLRRSENAPRNSTARLRLQRAALLHGLGPAPLAYFLREIEAGADVLATLEIYAALPADLIAAYGGDRFALAFHVIEGSGQ